MQATNLVFCSSASINFILVCDSFSWSISNTVKILEGEVPLFLKLYYDSLSNSKSKYALFSYLNVGKKLWVKGIKSTGLIGSVVFGKGRFIHTYIYKTWLLISIL